MIRAGAAVALFAAAAGAVHAGSRPGAYPARPIRVIVGFPPASAADIVARVTAAKLGEQVGQQVVVDNRPGAGSNIAAELAARAPADGHTLFIGTVANTSMRAFMQSCRSTSGGTSHR
jgi:tripartite-type tricarboxylate transporter receptor subunit TctC